MQDFVRYKVQILKNAAFKVIFFASSIDTQSQFDISILSSSTNIPIICVVGGNLNLDAIVPMIEPMIAQATISSGLSVDEALDTIAAQVAQAIIAINSTIGVDVKRMVAIPVNQIIPMTTTISIDATTKAEKEVKTAIDGVYDINTAINVMTVQLVSAICAGIIDINSNSIVSLPNPLTTNCAFASAIANEVSVQTPTATHAGINYETIVEASTILEQAVPAVGFESIEMSIACTLRTAHAARLEEYDAEDLSLLDNTSLLDLGFYMNFTY